MSLETLKKEMDRIIGAAGEPGWVHHARCPQVVDGAEGECFCGLLCLPGAVVTTDRGCDRVDLPVASEPDAD